MGSIAARLSLGVLLLGLLLGGWTRWIARSRPDRVVSFAWSLSLALVIAWLCILAIGAFTAGYGLTDEVVVAILALGGVGGCIYAYFASLHDSPLVSLPQPLAPRHHEHSSREQGV